MASEKAYGGYDITHEAETCYTKLSGWTLFEDHAKFVTTERFLGGSLLSKVCMTFMQEAMGSVERSEQIIEPLLEA